MDSIPLGVLFAILVGLILLSGFFSGSETALMSINRYRIKHKAKAKHRGAILVCRLLEKPDRLIGLILLGNNLVNILASMLATIIAQRLYPGELGLVIAAGILTLVILILGEVAPKTLSALHPDLLAYPSAFIYTIALKFLGPLVKVINWLANGFLRLLGVPTDSSDGHTHLSREELSTVVNEAGALIPKRHRNMLLNILQLEEATVEDIMVPRNEVVGIDLENSWEEILEQLTHIKHTRIPIYQESIDNIVGILHAKRILNLMYAEDFNREKLENAVVAPYFIPEGTPLTKQLLNFQQHNRRLALVVDEYGDLLGLATLEDILEEIVGKFTTDTITASKSVHLQADGSLLVDAGVHIRELNKSLTWALPTDGPKTLNGMILEHMEMIPEPGTSLLLHGLPVEITKSSSNAVKTVRIFPNKRQLPAQQASDDESFPAIE